MCTLIFCIQPQLLMPIIQYVLPSKSKPIKKLLHFYWEICPKYDENGKLKQEMILVWWVISSKSFGLKVSRWTGCLAWGHDVKDGRRGEGCHGWSPRPVLDAPIFYLLSLV